MIRRARLSFKPNVRPGARAPGSAARDGGETAAACPEEGDSCADSTPPVSSASGPDHSAPERPENAPTVSTENQTSLPTSTPLQRRKRISTLPNLAKPRVSSSAAVTPSQKHPKAEAPPTLPVSSTPSVDVVSPPETAKVVGSPKSQAPATLPDKRTPVPQVPQFSPHKKPSLKQSELSAIKSAECIKGESTPLKERPPQKSSPNEELKIEKPKKLVAAGFLEKERIKRAQKLRELLRDELRKERKIWKANHPVMINGEDIERSKMTMRDFIYFIPSSNPMRSSFEEPKTPEKTLTDSQVTGPTVKNIVNDDEDDIEEDEDESQSLAPRVKVAEDGSIILDEESLTVEVSRMKAPIVEGNDPIFERGSTTTYSSFRKNNYSKPWSNEETDMFFLAISMVGTDFSMIGQLFPHRERIEIKNKFKREERSNGWRIDKAFKEKQTFDVEFFAKRLEKALEKKQKSPRIFKPREKRAAKPRKKQKEKAAMEQILSDDESAVLSDREGDDARIEEKENEDSLGVKECLQASDKVPRKKRKSRKKNELEEENPKSQDEETSPVPHTGTKSRKKAGKAAAQSKDGSELVNENLEDVQAAAADTAPVKKKKTKKSKKNKKLEESTSEDIENNEIMAIQSPSRNSLSGKSASSAVPDSAEGNSQIYSEGDVQLSQPEAPSCEEGSSLLIFPDESGCLSGLSGLDLSSLQECLSEVPVTQSTLVVPNNTLDNDDVEDDHDLAETCPKEASLETSRHAHDYNETELSASGSQRKDDLVCASPPLPGQKDDGTELSPARAGVSSAFPPDSDTAKEDIDKDRSSRPVRGRLVRPKPNVTKVPVKNKPSVPAPDVSTPNTQDTEQLVNVPCSMVSSCVPANEKETPVTPTIKSSASSQDGGAKASLKPAPLLRGRFQRPKPNVMRASRKDNSDDKGVSLMGSAGILEEMNDTNSTICDPVQKNADSGNDEDFKMSLQEDPRANPVNAERNPPAVSLVNEAEKKSPNKSSPLTQGRLQRPKPNLPKLSARGVEMGGEKDKTRAESEPTLDNKGDISQLSKHVEEDNDISTCQNTYLNSTTVEDSSMSISAQKVKTDNIPILLSPVKPPAMSPDECKKSTIKSAPGTSGQLLRQTPNVLNQSSDQGKPEINEGGCYVASETTDRKPSPSNKKEGHDKEKSADLEKVILSTEKNSEHQNTRSESTDNRAKNLESLTCKPPEPVVQPSGPLQRPKPFAEKAVFPASDATRIASEGEFHEESTSASRPCTLSSLPANIDAEDSVSPEQTRSFILPLETIGLDSQDQTDREESHSMCVDNSSLVPKDLSASEAEKRTEPSKPALSRSRFQRPKPNLGRSLTRPAVSSPQKCSSTENNDSSGSKLKEDSSHEAEDSSQLGSKVTLLVDPACSEEPAKGASVKPVRNRFQRPKPNVSRVSVMKDSPTVEPKASVQGKGQVEISSKTPEECLEITTNKASSDKEEKPAPATLKPAPLKRGRLVRPVPNLNPPIKKPSPTPSKISDEESPSDKACDIQASSGSPGGKRKSFACPTGVSPKRIRPEDLGKSNSSEAELEQSLSAKALQDNSCFTEVPDDHRQQLSRFGRPLKKPLPTAPPVSPKPTENSSERIEKEKPTRSVKTSKIKVAKPASKPGKTALVKLRATQQDDDEDDVDDADVDFEEEDYDLSPEKQNQAPVFVPFSLRSPKPVPAQIEETVEEFEIPVEDVASSNDGDQQSQRSPHLVMQDVSQHVTSTEEDTQKQSLAHPDVSVSESLLENGDAAEEATFILTLVEIPIGDDYSYSCDVNSVDALPAPVLITSGSSSVMNLPQIESSVPAVKATSYDPPSAVQEQTELPSNHSSRKRSASGLSEENDLQPSKKALLSSSGEEGDGNRPKSKVVGLTAADIKTEEGVESCQGSFENCGSSTEGVKLPECTAKDSKPGTSGWCAKLEGTSLGSLNTNLPSAIANTPSVSGTSLQRLGRKPLGFLGLVCKEKQSKANKMNLPKSSGKNVPSSVQTIKKPFSAEDHEDRKNSQVPSQSTMPSESEVLENEDTIPEESSKPADLASEEDASQVSQFFFDDIFMEVDD